MTNEHADAVRAASLAFNDAVARRDLEGISACLLPTYLVVTARNMQRLGKEQSVRSWETLFEHDPSATHQRIPGEIHVNEGWGMAAEQGTWKGTLRTNAGTMNLEGVYAAKWQLTADGWKLQAEIFTPLSVIV